MADIGLNMVFSHIFDGLKMFFSPLYLMVYFSRRPLVPMCIHYDPHDVHMFSYYLCFEWLAAGMADLFAVPTVLSDSVNPSP